MIPVFGPYKGSTKIGAITYIASSTAGAQSTSCVVQAPAGIVAGNFLYATIVCDDLSKTATLASNGWTLDVDTVYTTHNNHGRLMGFYKFVTSSEPTSYTFFSTSVRAMSIGIMAFDGVSKTPFNVPTQVNVGTASKTAAFKSLTTSALSTVVLVACQGGCYTSTKLSSTFTPPTGYTAAFNGTSQYGKGTTWDAETIFGMYQNKVPAGVVSPSTGIFNVIYAYATLAISLNIA